MYNQQKRFKVYYNAKRLCFKTDKQLPGKVLGGFPDEVGIFTSEMSISSSLAHDGTTKVTIADDTSRTKVKVVIDNLGKLRISRVSLSDSSVGVYENREWVWHANGIRKLNESTLGKSRLDNGLETLVLSFPEKAPRPQCAHPP